MEKFGLSLAVLLAIQLNSCIGQSDPTMISVNTGLSGGFWGRTEFCPDGMYAVGFEQKVEAFSSHTDNSALNGIKLICRNNTQGLSCSDKTITSLVGRHGDWKEQSYCPPGSLMTQFFVQVQSTPYIWGRSDHTAVQNIYFRCQNESDANKSSILIQYPGYWGQNVHNTHHSSKCPPEKYICGIKTRVQLIYQSGKDNTGLNDVIMFCC